MIARLLISGMHIFLTCLFAWIAWTTHIKGNEQIDRVDSYFGMRKISLTRDQSGVLRLSLNNEIYFQYGPLDQGFWPDGIYRAPTDDALRYDIEIMKDLGFNMLRKHIKVESRRFYTWCDKLGILVWQDMPSGDIASRGESEWGKERNAQSARQFELEFSRIITTLYNHPSIVVRKTFTLSGKVRNPYFIIYHDMDQEAEIFLNGNLIAEGPGHQYAYTLIQLDKRVRKELNNGRNILAIHGTKKSRRQYIDAGMVEISNK